MKPFSKFSGPDLDSSVEFTHPNLWSLEQHPTWSRLRVGCEQGEVRLIMDLRRELNGPFGILYVLVLSRLGREPGRYQSPYPVEHEELEALLDRHAGFIEQDGRHHLWVMNLDGPDQFVYDNHNILYIYGDTEHYVERLRDRGFREGAVGIPSPHGHNYHAEYDRSEDELMNQWEWIHFPLAPDDDP